MSLLTLAQLKQLIANGVAQRARQDQDLEPIDFPPLVKFFTPDANATWLITEADPVTMPATNVLGRPGASEDCESILSSDLRLFGLCDLGLGYPELGYVSLTELQSLRGPLGLPVERDIAFTANQLLSDYAAQAHQRGCIIT